MGVWGTGLYSGDFALDLRSAIAALSRLPLTGSRILEILRESEPASGDAQNEEHTTFWLVIADQLHKRGIECPEASAKAIALIESGADNAMHMQLGMKAPDLRKREATLAELRTRLSRGLQPKPRRTLRKPQPFIMDVGDVYIYPTSGYHAINPYFKSKHDDPSWNHDGWSAMVIFARGRSFEYLAWYAALVLDKTYENRPTLQQLMEHSAWNVTRPGTCSAVHFKRMELEKVDCVDIDAHACAPFHPTARACTSATVSDISIANAMKARPVVYSKGPGPTVERLADVLA